MSAFLIGIILGGVIFGRRTPPGDAGPIRRKPEREPSPERGGRLRRLLRRRPLTALATALVLGGVIFYISAPLNIAARIGRYPGIGWVLHTYMEHWARSWSIGVDRPDFIDLSDPALVRLGAGYFEAGCAPCHGAPGRKRNPLVPMMEPPPPELADRIPHFDPKELFWIVWNGVRYTAMPGWTGDARKDEAWQMVPFLQRYPSLSAEEYVQLAYGHVEPKGVEGAHMSFGGLVDRLDETMKNCARCHGEDGLGRDGTAPKIAGQSREYLAMTLRGYAQGLRPSGFMQPIAAPLSEEEISELATHYASMRAFTTEPSESGENPPPADLLQLGARLAAEGDPTRFVPACDSCHRQDNAVPPRAIYPRIAGQERRFLEAWLRLYREGPFGGTPFANVMHYAAIRLTDHQIRALAAWYSLDRATRVSLRDGELELTSRPPG